MPRALYAFALPLHSGIVFGGQARLAGEQRGISALDFGMTSGGFTCFVRNGASCARRARVCAGR